MKNKYSNSFLYLLPLAKRNNLIWRSPLKQSVLAEELVQRTGHIASLPRACGYPGRLSLYPLNLWRNDFLLL